MLERDTVVGLFEQELFDKLGLPFSLEAARKLTAKFFYDVRWKLLNNIALRELLPWVLKIAQKEGRHFRLYYIDLHDLHKTNRQYGDAGGDALLKAVAQAVRVFYPPTPKDELPLISQILNYRQDVGDGREANTIVGRWGGDEFLALVLAQDEKALEGFERRLRAVLENETASMPDGKAVTTSVSMGRSDMSINKSWQQMLEEANAGSNREKKESGLGRG